MLLDAQPPSASSTPKIMAKNFFDSRLMFSASSSLRRFRCQQYRLAVGLVVDSSPVRLRRFNYGVRLSSSWTDRKVSVFADATVEAPSLEVFRCCG